MAEILLFLACYRPAGRINHSGQKDFSNNFELAPPFPRVALLLETGDAQQREACVYRPFVNDAVTEDRLQTCR